MKPTESQFRLAEIEVSKSTMGEKIIGMFRYDSDGRGLSNSGAVKRNPITVILADIASGLYVYEQLLDAINATAEQVRHLTVAVDTDPMARFEKLIQHLNEAVTDFLTHEPTPIAWNRVNIFVIETSEGHLCLSGLGRLTNIFLQKQADGSHRAFDLFGSLEQPPDVNPKKPFAALICGDMNPGDVLFAGSQNFDRLRDELRISERLRTLPPVTAALEIRQELERQNIPDDFAALVIACLQLPTAQATIKSEPSESKEKSTKSIEKLHNEELVTQAMLSPKLTPATNAETKAIPTKTWQTRMQYIWQKLFHATKKRTVQERVPGDPMSMVSLRSMNAGHGSFMTAKRKLISVLAMIIILAAAGGTLWYRENRRATAEQSLWNAVYNQALDKKNRADADLVYGNEERAKNYLKEANKLLLSLDEKTADRKKAKEELRAGFMELTKKLKHEISVDHPKQLTTLALGSPPNSLKTIAILKNKIFSVDSNAGAIIQTDTVNNEVEKIPLVASGTAPGVVASVAGNETLIILTNSRALLSFNPIDRKLVHAALTTSRASSTQAIAFYNKRLYLLDPQANMIWKYSPSGANFGSEATYLKQNTNILGEAKSISIDSNVYIGFGNGKMARYLSGVEETWSPVSVDPKLGQITSIWTTPETDRLVIADPDNKRIVIFRKDGKLIAQIVSVDFQNPTDIIGDATAKKIYVVDNNRILVLDLP